MLEKTKGRKFDDGKAEYGLIPPHALHAMVEVLTIGAKKYARDNWKHVPDRERRYFDAMQRHIWAWKRGEENDPEDGLHHLAHAMCCLMFLHEVSLYYKEGVNDGENKQKQDEAVAQKRNWTQLPLQFQLNRENPIPSSYGPIQTKHYYLSANGCQGSSTTNSSAKYKWTGTGANIYTITTDSELKGNLIHSRF